MMPFFIYAFITGVFNLFIIMVSIDNGDEIGLQWINPIVIYNNVHVNWFGCIVLTILAHIIAGPWACLYWFYKIIIVGIYKLCTVGRK